MKFDLYGSLSPQPEPKIAPKITTLDMLAAAEWTVLPDGKWQLAWDDHSEYDDVHIGGEGGTWTCWLYQEDGDWVFDFEHETRGGPQYNNGIGLDAAAPVEVAQRAVRRSLEIWIDRWENG